jgi:hypothetical protein
MQAVAVEAGALEGTIHQLKASGSELFQVCFPLQQQGLKALHIKLREQQAEGRVRRRVGDVGTE